MTDWIDHERARLLREADEINAILRRSVWPGKRMGWSPMTLDDFVVKACVGCAALMVSIPAIAVVVALGKAALAWAGDFDVRW